MCSSQRSVGVVQIGVVESFKTLLKHADKINDVIFNDCDVIVFN